VRAARVAGVLILGGAALAGITACVPSGLHGTSQQQEKSNLDLQRESALTYRNEWQPNVEKIRFKRDGDRPGLGASWRVNAVATVDGRDYEVIISPDLGPAFVGGTGKPPEAPTPYTRQPLTVIYSDGTSEVIE